MSWVQPGVNRPSSSTSLFVSFTLVSFPLPQILRQPSRQNFKSSTCISRLFSFQQWRYQTRFSSIGNVFHELGLIAQLNTDGLIIDPPILPPSISDVTALASWMAMSNLLNRVDVDAMEVVLATALNLPDS